eukprot:TRINITY_DN40891_c0_g1_i1.p1 TRINITY_DN40891_c0_g1~~TRINITY_DN40891_c0_g1_i1.p1  ORF type:complete len:699 (+),score=85.85 TRINITY_DN40891_c0_g1_i1:102-2198(+)
MASTGLHVASAAVAVGDAATGAGIGTAHAAVTFGMGLARATMRFGFVMARACVRPIAAIFEVTRAASASSALRRADSAIEDAHVAARTSMATAQQRALKKLESAREAAGTSMTRARKELEATANQEGLYYRMFLGSDTAQVILAVQNIVKEFATPLATVSKLELFRAARAWAAIQRAVRIDNKQAKLDGGTAFLVADSERWMRFSLAAFGAFGVGKLINDRGAAVRERRAFVQAARASVLNESSVQRGVSNTFAQTSEVLTDDPLDYSARIARAEKLSSDNGSTNVVSSTRESSGDELLGEARFLFEEETSDDSSSRQDVETLRPAQRHTSRTMNKEIRQRMRMAVRRARAYGNTPAGRGMLALTCAGIVPDDVEVLHFAENYRQPHGHPQVPGQLVVVDRRMACVVVALRGSYCLRDALVDLECKPESVRMCGIDGVAHGGMLRAARYLEDSLAPVVEAGLLRLRGPPRVLIVGHSLGAGVSSLLAGLWSDAGRWNNAEIKCIAFASPQVMDMKLAQAMRNCTTTYILGNDVVPRLGLATATDLRDTLIMMARAGCQGSTNDAAFSDDMERHACDLAAYGPARDHLSSQPIESKPFPSAREALLVAEQGDASRLAALYARVRYHVGSAPGRLYPAGRLMKLEPGRPPYEVSQDMVDEMVVTSDMVESHMPRRYLAAVQEATSASRCTVPLWRAHSSL